MPAHTQISEVIQRVKLLRRKRTRTETGNKGVRGGVATWAPVCRKEAERNRLKAKNQNIEMVGADAQSQGTMFHRKKRKEGGRKETERDIKGLGIVFPF